MKYYEKNFNLKLILQLVIVFFVGFVIARNNLIVGSIGSSFDSPYVNFYTEIIESEETFYSDRTCNQTYTLEERKKLRWVTQKIQNNIFIKSYEKFGPRGLAASFISIHAIFITLCFLFTKMTIAKIVDNKKLYKHSEQLTLLLFLTLLLYIFNGHTSEFSFSIIEGACIAAAMYFSRIGKIILFTFIVSIAVLNRESGFLIIFLWFIFNPKFDRNIVYFFVPMALFLGVNYDILKCMVDPALYIGSADYKINKTLGSMGDYISFMMALIFNYGVFYTLMSVIVYLARKNSIFYKEIKPIYLVFMLYTLIFIIFTPVSHLSIKYIVLPMVVISTVAYFSKQNS